MKKAAKEAIPCTCRQYVESAKYHRHCHEQCIREAIMETDATLATLIKDFAVMGEYTQLQVVEGILKGHLQDVQNFKAIVAATLVQTDIELDPKAAKQVDAFKQFAKDHKQIECFGYGNITDIEVPVDLDTGEPIQRSYPYMFINPTAHTWGANSITYRFNVIVMDMTTELTPYGFSGLDSVIKAQSDSLILIGDFLAWLDYQLSDDSLIRSTSITPFQERFQDTVAGMTAAVEFVLPKGLNFCDVPL
jgi:hypothetical protein